MATFGKSALAEVEVLRYAQEETMGRLLRFVGSLVLLWVCSFAFLLLAEGQNNYFLPSFATALVGIALLVSTTRDLREFFVQVQVRRVIFLFVPLTLFAIFGSKDSPDWTVVPPLVGLFMLSSAVTYRIDKARADRTPADGKQ